MFGPRFLALALVAVASSAAYSQQPSPQVKDTYRKIEYMIPMRDGRKLYTSVYVPRNKPGKHPILMQRTPYSAGPYGPEAYRGSFSGSKKMQESGFIFAYQDVRGKYMSEGDFVDTRPQMREYRSPQDVDESTDTYDTVDYLIKHVPDNNQRVGLWGISYPGGYAALGAINSHPALKAASPQAPTSDWFLGDDFHHQGAFFLFDVFRFYGGGFGAPRPVPAAQNGPGIQYSFNGDAYKFFLEQGTIAQITDKYFKGRTQFWMDAMRHGTYDEFWQNRSIPKSMVGVKCAVLNVGGWFDAEDCWGPPNVYRATEKQNPGTTNQLVMGPWFHGMWAGRGSGQTFADQDFGSNTSQYFQEKIEWPFFAQHLLEQGKYKPEAQVFESGANKWRTFSAWPPKGLTTTSLSFADAGALVIGEATGKTGAVSYISDPANPVPHEAGVIANRTREYMIRDQRFASERNDVATWTSPVLGEKVTMAGPIQARLKVRMTGTDADFVVKVIDVLPNGFKGAEGKDLSGYQMLVRGEILRGKFRNSFSNPSPFQPGRWEDVNFQLPDMFHTFLPGHKIMVQVQSSWFPLADRNPNQFTDIYSAGPEMFIKNNIDIMTGPGQSHLEFGRLN
jgi:putative CocE/NonD family hydrolase